MFTLPDASDATATCPAFKPVGPVAGGFFQDCNPGANFPGTIPIADYFNELIVNLRALLVRAAVAGVKGDETMLWRAIEQRIHALDIPQQLFSIDSAVTLNVAPGGSASPSNPLGGSPFDTLASAWHWLSFYTITANGYVTIQLATATYNHSAPLALDHPNGARITVVGGDSATTLLNFPNGTNGVVVNGHLASLSNLTIFGNKTKGTVGLTVNGSLGIYQAYVQGWDNGIVVQNGGFLGFTDIWTDDCLESGLSVNYAQVAGTTYNCINCGYFNSAPFYAAALGCTAGGVAVIDQVITTDTHKGLDISGAGSEARVRVLNIGATELTTAVEANDGGKIIASGSNPGDWNATLPAYFTAAYFSLIRSDNAFSSNARVTASPAVNVLGNINSMVTAI